MKNMETYEGTDIDAYYLRYVDGTTSDLTGYANTDTGDYYYYDWHWDYPRAYTYYSPAPENNTERAFKILKVLVKEKILMPPDDYYKFVKLVEKIAKVI